MAFTQPCFIRKNTPELIAKLEKIGYKRDCYFEGNLPFIYIGDYSDCGLGPLYSEANYGAPILFSTNFKRIDCKENEELFLALAALRDDSDYMQWFVMDVEVYMDINQGDWFLATDRNRGKHIGTQIDPMYCHKATVEEIIKHFKK